MSAPVNIAFNTMTLVDAERRAERAAIIALTNSHVDAPTLTTGAIDSLATRAAFADAVARLVEIIAPRSSRPDTGLVALLWVPPVQDYKAHRAALAFGIASTASNRRDEIVSYRQLRHLADAGSDDARCALAAIGGGRPWSDSSRRARATLLLRAVIRARRESAS